MKVFVVCDDYGYDGMSLPLFVGSNKEKAEAYIGRNHLYLPVIKEFEVDTEYNYK